MSVCSSLLEEKLGGSERVGRPVLEPACKSSGISEQFGIESIKRK